MAAESDGILPEIEDAGHGLFDQRPGRECAGHLGECAVEDAGLLRGHFSRRGELLQLCLNLQERRWRFVA